MLDNKVNTSLLIPSQLPEYIRDDESYQNFVAFIQAYYEWMEQTNNVLDRSKNILNYQDIDRTTEEFLQYFINDFLPYFPEEALIDKRKAVKIAKQLYSSKGTPASYQFLFRVLYNSNFDIFYTKDAVLRASDGIWYISRSLKLDSTDLNFLKVNNYRIFGETSKTIAVIDNSVLAGNKIEMFISNIERLFQSGEFVRVIDNNNQDVLFDGQPLRSKIVGQISQIKINPNRRGLLYQTGDPVIVSGGLSSNNGIGATAEVGETTTGSIQRIAVVNEGLGYRDDPDTVITITNAPGAIATVGSLDPNPTLRANVTLAPNNIISTANTVSIGNSAYSFLTLHPTSNVSSRLIDALSFESFSTSPISSIIVQNGGAGITKIPTVRADTTFTDLNSGGKGYLASLGILGPIQIVSGGKGYEANDTIVISNGSGYGAYANVTGVDANGSITTVSYVYGPDIYPLGGMGYKSTALPSLTVVSANVQASNAVLSIPGILGEGATFSVVVDKAGAITTINITNPGEDYVATPNVSLKVQDIVVTGLSQYDLPAKNDAIYQGTDANNSTYSATVDSISVLQSYGNPLETLYNLRVFDYDSIPVANSLLKIDSSNLSFSLANTQFDSSYNANGIKIYGDGNALATASFLNGLVVGQGQYLDTRGQPSSYSILQSEIYNNFTYIITVEKEIAKYRETLLNLLHPAGMKMLGRYALKCNTEVFNITSVEAINKGYTLQHFTGYAGSSVTMTTDFVNKSNNIVQFNYLVGANLADFITNQNSLEIKPTNGPYIKCEVDSVDPVANTVTLRNNTWLTFANVAYTQASANTNTINIISVTNSYDIINNGEYSNTAYKIKDIVYAGDYVSIQNNSPLLVTNVDYLNSVLYVSGNVSSNSNGLMAVKRTLDTTDIKIWGPEGLQYIPELTTEDGYTLTTEAGVVIILG